MSNSIQRVLIIEDDPDSRADLRRMLLSGSDRKYEFFEAELGLSALALMQENENSPFDCVLLEYHLPDMDAPEVLVSLCNGKDMPPCPVVVITGSDRKAGPTLLRAGAQDYLGKSWLSAESLTRAIDNAIERFAMLRERVKSEKSLRESEEKFRTLLESAPDAMVIVDQEGKIFLVNAQAERIFGYSRLELLGANVEMLIPARSHQRHVEQRATYLEHPKTRAMNAGPAMLGLRKDGTEFPIEVSLSPLKTTSGTLFCSSIRDVTERVADKNSILEGASRLALAVKVSGLAIAEIDYATGMNHLSADAARLFGLGEVAMTVPRAAVHATFHPDDSPELLRCIAESLSPTGEGWFAMDHRVIWPNGEVHWLRVRKQVLFEGEGVDKHPAHSMLATFDVTAEKNASEIVRAGGEFVRGVLDSLPEHVVVLDDLGNVLAVNKPWDFLAVENGGALDATSIGLNYLDLCRNSIATGAPHVLATIEGLEAVLNGSRTEFVAEYSCPASGIDKWYAMHAKRMRYGNSGVVVSHVDITDTKRARSKLEDSETRFRRLFEAAHDGILILDAITRKITHVNPFLTTLLDYPAEHFLGKELWEIGFLKDKQASVSAMQQLDELGSIRYESLPLEDSHGMKHPVEMVANKYEEGHHPVIQCNIRDISERRRLEKQMLVQASELSDLHRRKDEFLAMLSHELRSPLAPIANAVQLLGLQKAGESRIQQQARGIIERQVGQLQHLVDDLLEVSRITTGRVQLRLERIDMCRIAEGAAETARPLIEQRRHELTVTLPQDPVWMVADAARLEQVLVNLLTNASKYTEGGGHIWLTVELVASDEWRVASENSGEGRVTSGEKVASIPALTTHHLPLTTPSVVIRVRDTGVGISPSLLPHIFDLFTQADRSLDRSQGGLGIGLALVQSLTELHGGTVEAFSTLGEGSEFVVRLPIRSDEWQVTSGETSSDLTLTTHHPSLATPLKVLVVDDNVDTVLGFSMLLKASGHDVRTAHDGLSAVETAIAYRPNVVLLDIGLPGLNGYEVAKRLRQHPDLKNTVLIALTGYGQDTDRQASQQAGFDHHLVKPARFDQLKKILATVLEGLKV